VTKAFDKQMANDKYREMLRLKNPMATNWESEYDSVRSICSDSSDDEDPGSGKKGALLFCGIDLSNTHDKHYASLCSKILLFS
jgi:hypothetical protein